MAETTPITLDEAARLAEHALATAQRHPGASVVLTPYVVRCLLDAAPKAEAGEGADHG